MFDRRGGACPPRRPSKEPPESRHLSPRKNLRPSGGQVTVFDDVSRTLNELGVEGWEASVALRLAEAVDDSGTASAAQLLGTLMGRLTTENTPTGSEVERIIATYRAQLPANFGGPAARKRAPESTPETLPESAPEAPVEGLSGTLCVECGGPMETQNGGRPRVRHPHCRRTRRGPRG